MLFWIFAGVLTFAACLAVLLPALRREATQPLDADFDLEVYQDQLAEVERDAARGAIAPAEAEQARAEIGRRILKLDRQRAAGSKRSGSHLGRVVATIAVLAVPVASWGIYAATGSPNLPAQPLYARLAADPAESSMAELVARAESHLAANPQDGRGWDVLAPIYYRMGRFAESATAYRNAIRLLEPTAARESGLGEAIAAGAGGVIIAEAQAALERALELNPADPKARFLLAAGLAQEGRTQEAADAWRAMLTDLPADSPWRGAVGQAIAGIADEVELPGPTPEEIEAAGLISDNDREAMIDSMVAGLDQRLRENPQDTAGWQRLVHSYVVMGRPDAAADALARGLDALGHDSEAGNALAAFAAQRDVGQSE